MKHCPLKYLPGNITVFKKKPEESLRNSPLLSCKHIFPIFIKLPSFRTV